jgi:hypothetical protein
MKIYRMHIKTEGIGTDGRATRTTELVPNLTEGELDSRRDAARRSAPVGSTRTIKVTEQR